MKNYRINLSAASVVYRPALLAWRFKSVWIVLVLSWGIISSYGFLRKLLSDREVASRAEYIVIGKIREGSLTLINHKNQTHEHHADLLISEVLKGRITSNSITISIHYGIDPVVDASMSDKKAPKAAIELWDTGGSLKSRWPMADDIRTDQIWLLHREKNLQLDGSDWIGIYDPEDVQPLSNKQGLIDCMKNKNEILAELKEGRLNHNRKGHLVYLLGELRPTDAETIESLVDNIGIEASETNRIYGFCVWGPYPAQEELEKIGKLALNPVLARLCEETDRVRRQLLCQVLVNINGKNGAGEKVTEEQIKAQLAAEPDPNKAANLAATLAELKRPNTQ